MATNKPVGDNQRFGAVKQRTQLQNPQTKLWIKRGPNGQFMDVKTSEKTPFKGIRKEK